MHVHFGLSWLHQWMYCIFTTGIILTFAILVYKNREKDGPPGILQNIGEIAIEFMEDLISTELGRDKLSSLLPFLCTLLFFILISNLFLIIPNAHPPTSDWSNTVALAMIVIIALQFYNIKFNGPKKAIKLWLDPIPELTQKETTEGDELVKPEKKEKVPSSKDSGLLKIAAVGFFILYFVDNAGTLLSLSLKTMVVYCLVASFLISAFALWARSKLRDTANNAPSGIQCFLEWTVEALLEKMGLEEEEGSSIKKFLFLVIGSLIFIAGSVFLLFIPFKHPATINAVSIYSLILVTPFIIVYIHKKFPWLNTFWAIIWLPIGKLLKILLAILKQLPLKILIGFFILLHVFDNGARLLSLSLRLFGNIFGEHTVLTMVTEIAIKNYYFVIPLAIPFMILCLDLVFACVQTLVFVMLSLFYFKEELGIH